MAITVIDKGNYVEINLGEPSTTVRHVVKPFDVDICGTEKIQIGDGLKNQWTFLAADITGYTYTDIYDLKKQLMALNNNYKVDANVTINTSGLNLETTQVLVKNLLQAIQGNIDATTSSRASEATLLLVRSALLEIRDYLDTVETQLSTLLKKSDFEARINTLGQKTMAESTPVVISSNQSPIPISGTIISNTRDIIQEIQMTGFYNGKIGYVFNVMGKRSGFTSTTVFNDLKDYGSGIADIATLTSSDALEVVSSSPNDTAAGTGARTIKVTYINSSNIMAQSPAITLNGTTPVPAGFTANEILFMEVNTVGSNNVAVGNVRLRKVTGAVEVEQITALGNRSLTGRFMVQDGYTGYITQWKRSSVNNDQDIRLRAKVDSFTGQLTSPYHFIDQQYIALNNNANSDLPWIKIPSLSRIKISTISSGTGGSVRCDASFIIILIEN